MKSPKTLGLYLLLILFIAAVLALIGVVGHGDYEEANAPPPPGMAKIEIQQEVQINIPRLVDCPLTKFWHVSTSSHCVPAGDAQVQVEYGDTWGQTEEPVEFSIRFLAGHRYRFKAQATSQPYSVAIFWVEDAADRSVVAGDRPRAAEEGVQER